MIENKPDPFLPEIWVADDDQSIRWVLKRALGAAGLRVVEFDSAERLLEALGNADPDVVVSDIRMTGMDGLALLERLAGVRPDLPVIIMTAYSDLDSAVSAFGAGAFEYLPKPFDVDEAVSLVRRALDSKPVVAGVARGSEAGNVPEILGSAPAMQEVFRAIGRLARSHMTVLITGESGTGKELVARALHRHSPRAEAPFIALNTAAIPRELLESELFGHERGAFTGAQTQRRGRFEQADGGTLFLDEIGDMPSDLQTRLLRVLAQGEFYRVGGHAPIRVDVRILAATHQRLEHKVEQGQFREDLFHRINVIRVHVPALRERCEDIPVLLRHFLTSAASELGVAPKSVSARAEADLVASAWPGNVRQMENTCRLLTVMAAGSEIRQGDLPAEIRGEAAHAGGHDWCDSLAGWARAVLASHRSDLLAQALPDFERTLIRVALECAGGKRREAARLLGWGRNTLTRKMQAYDMD